MIRKLIPVWIKDFIKIVIAIILRVISIRNKENLELRDAIVLSDAQNPTFFGYHDKTPFSNDGSKILAMSVNCDDSKSGNECSPMKVGCFQKDDKGVFQSDFISFASTTTWCWQQGCMLQWHPLEPDRYVIFNALVDGEYGSIVFDIEKQDVIHKFRYPIYAIDPTGRLAVTLNFSRLGRLRPGYGYKLLPDITEKVDAPEDDGLFVLDIGTGKRKQLISLAKLSKDVDGNGHQHYINHATFSPDGKKILFFHLWTKGINKAWKLRVCVMNPHSGKMDVLESERKVSHYCWQNKDTVIATTRRQDGVWEYSCYDLLTNTRQPLGLNLEIDGHPMFHPVNKNVFVTDSYPDRKLDQSLYSVDLTSFEVSVMATLYSHYRYRRQARCDLHPRWDREGNYVIVDSTVLGKRKMILFRSGI